MEKKGVATFPWYNKTSYYLSLQLLDIEDLLMHGYLPHFEV
jgi:hypothetical protein